MSFPLCVTSDNVLVSVSTEAGPSYVLKTSRGGEVTKAVFLAQLPKPLDGPIVLVVDSTGSGLGRQGTKGFYHSVIAPLFSLLEIQYEYIATKSASHISELAASLRGDTTVVLLSGDTSIGELINGLSDGPPARLVIAPIPQGTGNALSHSLREGDTPLLALRALLGGVSGAFPVYRVTLPAGSFTATGEEVTLVRFFVVVSWCFHASLVADSDTPEMRKMGLERFQVAAQKNLSHNQVYRGSVVLRGTEGVVTQPGPFSYWVLTPAKRFEATFDISPLGNVFENCLYQVAVQSADTNDTLLEVMAEVYAGGRHVRDPRVTYSRVGPSETVILTIEEPSESKRRICIDGTIVVVGKGAVAVDCLGCSVGGWSLHLIQ